MTYQSPVSSNRPNWTVAVAILIAAVIVATAILATSPFSTTVTKTILGTTTQSANFGATTTACTIVGEGFLLMNVLNSSNGEPIGSLPIQVEALYPACLSNPPFKEDMGTVNTNASGILSLGGPYNEYFFTINHGLRSYSVNASINAGLLTCVTLSIPSGDLNITQACNPTDHLAHETTTLTTSSVNTGTSVEAALLATCSQAQSPGAGVWKLVAGTNLAAVICFQLYYYNATAPLTLNVSQALSIQALQYIANGSISNPRSFSGASNFTVIASQNQLIIGGPNNENEGAVIAYAMTAKSGASGTYQLGFIPSGGLSNWMLSPQEPLQCGYYGQLVAGNGQPNYVQPTGCITYKITTQSSTTATTSGSNYHTIPGIPYPLLNGDVYFQITGIANSTQIGGIG